MRTDVLDLQYIVERLARFHRRWRAFCDRQINDAGGVGDRAGDVIAFVLQVDCRWRAWLVGTRRQRRAAAYIRVGTTDGFVVLRQRGRTTRHRFLQRDRVTRHYCLRRDIAQRTTGAGCAGRRVHLRALDVDRLVPEAISGIEQSSNLLAQLHTTPTQAKCEALLVRAARAHLSHNGKRTDAGHARGSKYRRIGSICLADQATTINGPETATGGGAAFMRFNRQIVTWRCPQPFQERQFAAP